MKNNFKLWLINYLNHPEVSVWNSFTTPPDDNRHVICEVINYTYNTAGLPPKIVKDYRKGQYDTHGECFFTTQSGKYEELNCSRWTEIK